MATKSPNAGVERVARRKKQADHAEQAVKESQLASPKGPEKDAKIAEAKARTIARFGGEGKTDIRKTKQAENKAAADKEAVKIAATSEDQNEAYDRALLGLRPGDTPSPRQLRLIAKAQQQPMIDEAHEIARSAGLLIKDKLIGRRANVPMSIRRHRRIEQSTRQMANANATS